MTGTLDWHCGRKIHFAFREHAMVKSRLLGREYENLFTM